MPRRAYYLIGLLGCAIAVLPSIAQEGHPLTGTWAGDWGLTITERTHLTLVMNWDGKNISGTINPGPDAIPLSSVYLDVTNWTVRIEADTKDSSGKAVHIAAEGRLEDLSSYHRRIEGTWRQGTAQGDFRITRD